MDSSSILSSLQRYLAREACQSDVSKYSRKCHPTSSVEYQVSYHSAMFDNISLSHSLWHC